MMTYISLFSSAGIGCYGFKMADFKCIATNELIERRLNIQKYNNKCKYSSGYICGDITKLNVKQLLLNEIEMWKKKENLERLDVLVATPPCQGMSIANHKKSSDEIIRNSLVVESIKLVKKLKPRFFIFENVPAFMKTICTDVDGKNKPISDAILNNLGDDYWYESRIINFKNYGACSSRQRTLVIGVSKSIGLNVLPADLYPELVKEKTLRQVIGEMPSLNRFGEIDSSDVYHSFRVYPIHMREWIKDLAEGESAFDNKEDLKKPHQVINGEIVINKQKNRDKYKRQYWDKVGPCIHTRNDQLASQNTIHPKDDRVFSIRELMIMMTVPKEFKWVEEDIDLINAAPDGEKRKFLKKEEIKIRQSLGEAVPTIIFYKIAEKIKQVLNKQPKINSIQLNKIIKKLKFDTTDELIEFIQNNPMNLTIFELSKVAEMSNTKRTDNAAYFTDMTLIKNITQRLPLIEKENITILEPSVGVGNFLPLIIEKFKNKKVTIDVLDIDEDSIRVLKVLITRYNIPANININFLVGDFLTYNFDKKYDYVIGNPPFYKLRSNDKKLEVYRKNAVNKKTLNICSFFLDKALKISRYMALVLPKSILNAPEFRDTREYLEKKKVDCIIDFGEKGFPGVLIETIALMIDNEDIISSTKVVSITKNIEINQQQHYIFDNQYPYWIIYRNNMFDKVASKIQFDVFNVFRDRQITNKYLNHSKEIRIIRSRNITDDGKKIIDIEGYDAFIEKEIATKLTVYEYINRDDVYLTPNMTYKPRLIRKPKGVLVNGSVAILIPKQNLKLTEQQQQYFSSTEYREFYRIARNYQTRSLNVDACSVYFYGLLKTNK